MVAWVSLAELNVRLCAWLCGRVVACSPGLGPCLRHGSRNRQCAPVPAQHRNRRTRSRLGRPHGCRVRPTRHGVPPDRAVCLWGPPTPSLTPNPPVYLAHSTVCLRVASPELYTCSATGDPIVRPPERLTRLARACLRSRSPWQTSTTSWAARSWPAQSAQVASRRCRRWRVTQRDS